MLWHNRLALVAEVFSKNASEFNYSAFVSNSRDGEPLAILAKSYPNGDIIRVHHQMRHQALKEMIQRLQKIEKLFSSPRMDQEGLATK